MDDVDAIEQLAVADREIWGALGSRQVIHRRDRLARQLLQSGVPADTVAARLGVRTSDVTRWAETGDQDK